MKFARLLALGVVSLLPACASVMEGTSESVAINTTPAGASCTVDRAGTRLGTVAPTPGSVNVAKSKNDITVACTKEGFEPAQVSASPKFVGTTFGNVLVGGLVGVAVDAATGANFDLPEKLDITLAPSAPPTPPVAMAPRMAPIPVSTVLPARGKPGV
ncbi:hypothetical protein [Paracraurococcus lichenis]|uniref:Translation initiation factor 2 n=1 Tax=Paracraurococcus lichenis TaxID=3064888 RepID=A0ABT9E8G1_9PROT|nr:hypothetical protein [Paracraurococcus sp. LOR1-02]MDO9712487.1 hypothetical protein [Paracraurococcus sp. LOR1-02]